MALLMARGIGLKSIWELPIGLGAGTADSARFRPEYIHTTTCINTCMQYDWTQHTHTPLPFKPEYKHKNMQ